MDELSLSDYLSIVKRRRNCFTTTAGVLLALSVLCIFFWSNYRAAATIAIEPPEVPVGMTAPTGMSPSGAPETPADLRIGSLREKVLSTASLADIVTKFNLYAGDLANHPMAEVAEEMRKKIALDLVTGPSAGKPAAVAFALSFDHSDALLAQKVASELAARFLEEDLKDRRAQAKETSALFAAQIAALEETLAEQEKKIAEFQAAQGDTRPEALLFNQQAAVQIAQNVQRLESELTANEGTQGALKAQLATVDPYSRVIADGQILTTPRIQLKALQAKLTTFSAQYGPSHPDVIKTKNQIEALKEQIENEGRSAELKAKITDTRINLAMGQKTKGAEHPDITALQNRLKNLGRQLTEEKNAFDPSAIKSDADNPAYLQLVAQLRAAEEQNKSLKEQRAGLMEQQAKYQQAIVANPDVERQLASLRRDYDNAQLRYRELKEKKMAADMSEQMEQDSKGQRLVIINPPELPQETTPPRALLLLIGILFSVMGGIASMTTAHLADQSIVGAHHLESLLKAAPLVTIPHITTRKERNKQSRHGWYLTGIASAALILAAIVVLQRLGFFQAPP